MGALCESGTGAGGLLYGLQYRDCVLQLPPHSPFRGRPLRIVAGVVVLLALAGYVAAHFLSGGPANTRCVVRGGDGAQGGGARYELTAEQAVNASVISAVGTSRGMPERAVTIALATALQESALRNIEHGDRDSLGLFQQRPSQGWGTADQILDPAYSAGRFYQHLNEVPGYSRLPLTVAAQRVQKSGFPQAYAKHETDAALLASALTGRTPASLSCEASQGGTDGRGGDPAEVRKQLTAAFGPDVLPAVRGAGGPAAGGAGAAGKTVVVPVPGASAGDGREGARGAGAQRGWEVAHWAMAHSVELRIARIAYAGQEWRADQGDRGWRRVPNAGSGTDSAEVRITTAG